MLLKIYIDGELANTFTEHTEVQLLNNVWAYATKTGTIKKMKVVDHMDGTAIITFWFYNNCCYRFENVPYSHGYILAERLYK